MSTLVVALIAAAFVVGVCVLGAALACAAAQGDRQARAAVRHLGQRSLGDPDGQREVDRP